MTKYIYNWRKMT